MSKRSRVSWNVCGKRAVAAVTGAVVVDVTRDDDVDEVDTNGCETYTSSIKCASVWAAKHFCKRSALLYVGSDQDGRTESSRMTYDVLYNQGYATVCMRVHTSGRVQFFLQWILPPTRRAAHDVRPILTLISVPGSEWFVTLVLQNACDHKASNVAFLCECLGKYIDNVATHDVFVQRSDSSVAVLASLGLDGGSGMGEHGNVLLQDVYADACQARALYETAAEAGDDAAGRPAFSGTDTGKDDADGVRGKSAVSGPLYRIRSSVGKKPV